MIKQIDSDDVELQPLPKLLLGSPIGKDFLKDLEDVELVSDREWLIIDHQTSGVACEHVYLFATVLKPTVDTLEKMLLLAGKYDSSNLISNNYLTEILKYRTTIKKLWGRSVDCIITYPYLREALYPLDCYPALINRLSSDKFPRDIKFYELLFTAKYDSDDSQMFITKWFLERIRYDMNLYIICENSD